MPRPELDSDRSHLLKIYIGNEKKYKFVLRDENNDPIPLTVSDILYLAVKKNPKTEDDADAIFKKTIALTGQPPADLSNGIVRFTITPAESGAITVVGRFRWDCMVWRSAGSSIKNVPDPAGHVVIAYPVRRSTT